MVAAEGQTAPASATPAAAQIPGAPPDLTVPSQENPAARLNLLYQQAAERYATMDSYIVRLQRREQVNGKDKPDEVILFKFRKEPRSVYFKWLGPEGKGREVVWVKDHYENKIHTILAPGDVPLMGGGNRFAVDPDSIFVKTASRHSIREAGVGTLIERLGILLAAWERGDPRACSFRYLGTVKRPEFEAPCEAAEQLIPPGFDPLLPRGGKRLWVFDTSTKLPGLIETWDDRGHEVEYYCYDRYQFPVRLDDDDFNPDKLWPTQGKPRTP
jgi:hypothetical protein